VTRTSDGARAALIEACIAMGLDAQDAQPLRIAENQTWRIAGVIVRIAPSDRLATAAREVRVARWLAERGVAVVRPLSVEQPKELAGRVVTFWEEAPTHTHGDISDVAFALKKLHSLPLPEFDIGVLDPLVRIPERLSGDLPLSAADHRWLLDLHRDLTERWAEGLPQGLPHRGIHGDAWPGNIVRTDAGWLLMDLERFSVGPPEWDLASTAVRARTTGAVAEHDYRTFCAIYGHDVTEWSGYDLLARTRELRMATYSAQHAVDHPEWRATAQYRVECLRGRHGPRPWDWQGIM
jgi:hypothetical protein